MCQPCEGCVVRFTHIMKQDMEFTYDPGWFTDTYKVARTEEGMCIVLMLDWKPKKTFWKVSRTRTLSLKDEISNFQVIH